MAKITLDLNKFKASGVYTIEFDASERITVTTQTIRLVAGFSRVGPINAPVFLRDINTSRRIFGEIDTYLEKRGSFFHRALETCLSVGPVFALNLMPLKSTPINEGGDATNYRSFAVAANEENGPVTKALVTSFYNKERFWFPDTEYVIATQDAKPINRDYLLTVVNLSQAPLSVLTRKSVNVSQYNVTAQDYYGLGNVPSYMHPSDFLSDYFLDLVVVEGDWTNLALLNQDPTYSKYFDARGIRADKLDAFLSLDAVTMVGSFTGTIIPDFIDNNGANQNLENIVNAAVGLTGIFIAINNNKIEDYANSVHKIDTIGNSLINTTDDTIDFLSYNTPIKSVLEFSGNASLFTTANVYSSLSTSTISAYIKSQAFGGTSGKFNNVLVIPKPQPGDIVFLPSQYQYILDNLTVNSLVGTYGIDSFNSPAPSDAVKVENVVDTGTALEIQLSTPLHTTTNYEDTFVFTGTATAIPSVSGQIAISALTPKDNALGTPYTFTGGEILLVEANGLSKYYEVLSGPAAVPGTVTVKATGAITTTAPYYLSRYIFGGLDINDYAAYVQPADLKVTVFDPNYGAIAVASPSFGYAIQANNSVPAQGLVLPSVATEIDSLTFVFAPNQTLNSYEGIGSKLKASGSAVTFGFDQVAVTVTDPVANLVFPGPYYISTITNVAYPSAATGVIQIVDGATGTVQSFTSISATLVAGDPVKLTLIDSGVVITGNVGNPTVTQMVSTDINKLRYIEAYPGSKLANAVSTGLVVTGDSVKYGAASSEYNYLGVLANYSKSATTGTIDNYSEVAYGVKGVKVSQYSDVSLNTTANATYAGLNFTYIDTTIYTDGSGTTNDAAIYSATAKNISSNIVIVGTLYGGGKKFELSATNAANLNVGDLVQDNSAIPHLTRVVQKVKKVNPSTGVVTYEYTVLDTPLVNTVTNTITKFTPIQNFCDRYQFTLLNGYVLGDYHIPNNTDAQIDKIYGVIENTNIGKTLASRDVISFRYIIDTFNGGIAPQMGPKSILSRLAANRQKCMALLNAPSIKQFIESTDPRFTELPDPNAGNPKPVLNTSYIKDGGNLSLGPSFRFSLPDEENGAKFIGVFSPNILLRENNKNISVPPAADVSNNFVRKFINGQPYAIVAGPRRGVISNPKYAGLEYEFLLQDRENIEPFGINPIVTVKGIGPMIFANQTAFQKTLSAFNNLHVRDLLITVEEAVEDVLAQYLFEFNDASTRLEIRTIVENYLDTVRNAGGVYNYAVIMDDTNNTAAIIDQNFGILDIGIEPARGLQKFINRITILKTGTISSGGFSAA
jgi:hypothetical protein